VEGADHKSCKLTQWQQGDSFANLDLDNGGKLHPDATASTDDELQVAAGSMQVGELRARLEDILRVQDSDPNFPGAVLDKIRRYFGQSMLSRLWRTI
jgi:hypothetical protein